MLDNSESNALFESPAGNVYIRPMLNKDNIGAEVLLSRLYKTFGISCASYYPLVESYFYSINDYYVLCDSVRTASNIVRPSKKLNLNLDRNAGNNWRFTDKAIENQTTMRILDLGSKIFDRHQENYFHKYNEAGKIDDVVAIDFEMSANNDPSRKYYNDFTNKCISKNEFLTEIKTNENLGQYIDKQALAEQMGKASDSGIVEQAKEIKDSMNFSISSRFTNNLRHSFNEVAEALEQ